MVVADPSTRKPLATVIQATYQGVADELGRITRLLNAGDQELSDEVDRLLSQGLGQALCQGLGKVRDRYIDSNDFNEARAGLNACKELIDQGDPTSLATAWQQLELIKSRYIEQISQEILAVIGGLTLARRQLDFLEYDPNLLPDYGQYHGDISASTIATAITQQLAQKTGHGFESVLIVAEESPRRSSGEILRLRFPACDVWHLPFVAYEYGYVVASHRSDKMNALRVAIKQRVRIDDPALHNPPSGKEAACFFDDVRRQWAQFAEAAKRGQASMYDYIDQYKTTRERLAERQDSFVSRLFADAFATLFMGPAYVYALLHLVFGSDPLTSAMPDAPCLALRFVVAFETLTWMNDDPPVAEVDVDVFEDEVLEATDTTAVAADDPLPLMQVWRLALRSAGVDDPYATLLDTFSPWIEEFKKCLSMYQAGARATYANWQVARTIASKLTDTDMHLGGRPSCFAVINAAWRARAIARNDPTLTQVINSNAVRLLNNREWGWLRPTDERPAGRTQDKLPESGAEAHRQDMIWDVIEALGAANNQPMLKLFNSMRRSNSFRRDPDLLDALSSMDDMKGLNAFMSLYQTP